MKHIKVLKQVFIFFVSLFFVAQAEAQKDLLFDQSFFTDDASCATTIQYLSSNEGVVQKRFFSKTALDQIRHQNRLLGSFANEKGSLQSKPFFTTSFLKQYKKVSSFIASPAKGYEHCKGELITYIQEDGYQSKSYFFDRKSDVLIIAAPGFGYAKEIMTPIVELFPLYDILLLEHRGHGNRVEIKSINDEIFYKLFGIAPSWIICGKREVTDLMQVVHQVFEKNGVGRHKKRLGLGFCYSSLIFSEAAVQDPTLFTHLVCDGAIVALSEVFSRLQNDTSLFAPIFGGSSGLSYLLRFPTLHSMATSLLLTFFKSQSIFDQLLNSALSNVESFASVQIPVMIWQGEADTLVPRADFELLFNRLASRHKCAIITPHRHLLNYLKEKELYAWAINRFLSISDLTSLS